MQNTSVSNLEPDAGHWSHAPSWSEGLSYGTSHVFIAIHDARLALAFQQTQGESCELYIHRESQASGGCQILGNPYIMKKTDSCCFLGQKNSGFDPMIFRRHLSLLHARRQRKGGIGQGLMDLNSQASQARG